MKAISLVAALCGASLAHASKGSCGSKPQSVECCRALAKLPCLHGKVFGPDSVEYNSTLASYWSASAALPPWCFVLPESTDDVSAIMTTLVDGQCPFGITSGGHGIFAGSNSVDKGVDINFANMNETSYDSDTQIASLRPGGRWGNVYDYLALQGVTVTGGRDPHVGVGGFITGGGNSFHSAAHGFACDNVKNFEVVLANGTIVNANEGENPDLWTALKGSSANIGIVTRFDMYTIPFGDPDAPFIWGGLYIAPFEYRAAIIQTLVNFTDSVDTDHNSSVISIFAYEPLAGGWFSPQVVANTLGIADPPALRGFKELAFMNQTTLSTMRAVVSLNSGQAGLRNIWLTTSFANDEEILTYATERLQTLVTDLNDTIPEGSYWNAYNIQQPLVKRMTDAGLRAGGNVMGLNNYTAKENGIMLSFNFGTVSADAEELARPMIEKYIADIGCQAEKLGVGWGWEYLNYADGSQDPLATVGEEARTKIIAAAEKYDPDGVFQQLRHSGHKI